MPTDVGQPTEPGAQPHAAQSADELKTAARDAGGAVKSALSDATGQAKQKSAEKVDAATTTAGDSLGQLAQQLRQAADGLGDQAWAQQALAQGADGLERVSGYLRNGRFDDFARDMQTFARSNPAAFLAGSVALGFLAARVAKTAAERTSEGQPQAPGQSVATSQFETFDEGRSFAPVDVSDTSSDEVIGGYRPGGVV